MNLSLPFIERPVMTTLVVAAMVIFGAYGYSNLPVSDLPNVDFPTISVMASLPEPHIVKKVATGDGGVIHGKKIKRFIIAMDNDPAGQHMASGRDVRHAARQAISVVARGRRTRR